MGLARVGGQGVLIMVAAGGWYLRWRADRRVYDYVLPDGRVVRAYHSHHDGRWYLIDSRDLAILYSSHGSRSSALRAARRLVRA